MLEGTIKYYENGKEYEILARAVDGLSLQMSLTANDLATVEMFDELENSSGSYYRNFQVNESTVKTQIPNKRFSTVLGALIKYAKTHQYTIYREVFMNVGSEFMPDAIATYNIPEIGVVKTNMGMLYYLDIKNEFVEVHMEDVFCDEVNFGAFDAPSYNVKMCKESLGFDLKVEEDMNVDENEGLLYQTLEEIIVNNPEKDFLWLRNMDFHIVTDDTVDEVCEMFMNSDKPIAMDTETTGLTITFKSRVGEHDVCVGVILSNDKRQSYYFPLQHKKIDNLCGGDHFYFMEKYMKPILENKQIICHNGAYDWKVCYIYDINTNIVFDTMIAFQCTYRYKIQGFEVGLKPLTKQLFNRDSLELSDLTKSSKWGSSQIKFWDLPAELVKYYACADATNTLELYEYIMKTGMLKEFGAEKIFEIEVIFSKCVSYQEFWGHRVNTDELPEMISDIDKILARTYAEMVDIVGHEFNPNSPKQMIQIFYEELGLPEQKKYDKGVYKVTTDKEARKKLMAFEDDNEEPLYPIAKIYNEYCEAQTIKSNFLNTLGKKKEYGKGKKKTVSEYNICTDDGFLFSDCGAFNTETGRVSTSQPNYQGYNGTVKKRIVPRQGFYITDNDYSSIEYRVLASMSGEKALIEAFKDPDLNYHTYQASRIFDVPYESVSGSLRKQAKGINFGLPYGMGDESLGARVFGERTKENARKASKLRGKYFDGQEHVENFFEEKRDRAVELGYSETFFGRRRWYDKTKESEAKIRRQSGNAVIQGTAADLYKIGVCRLFIEVCNRGWLGKVFFGAFVHDAITCEVHESINPMLWLSVVKESFELKIDGWCDLYIGFGFGRDWNEAHSIEIPVQLQNEFVEKYKEECPFWDGDVPKFCDTIAEKIEEYEINKVKNYITNPDSQGKVIDPVVNTLLASHSENFLKGYFKRKTDFLAEKNITSVVDMKDLKKYLHDKENRLQISELNPKQLLTYKNKYLAYEYSIEDLNSKLSEGGLDVIDECELREYVESNGQIYLEDFRPSKDMYKHMRIFCLVENLDFDSIDIKKPEVSTGGSKNDLSEEEEIHQEVENIRLARVENFGVCVVQEESAVILNLIPNKSFMNIIKGKLNREGKGYKVKLFSFEQNMMYETPSYLDYKLVQEVQQLYMIR